MYSFKPGPNIRPGSTVVAGRNLAFLTVVLIGGSSRPQQTFRQAGYEAGYVDTFTHF